jgi:hypothetical protein
MKITKLELEIIKKLAEDHLLLHLNSDEMQDALSSIRGKAGRELEAIEPPTSPKAMTVQVDAFFLTKKERNEYFDKLSGNLESLQITVNGEAYEPFYINKAKGKSVKVIFYKAQPE